MAAVDVSRTDGSTAGSETWLEELRAELGEDELEDRHYAYRVLAAFLHALGDRLPAEEAARLAEQLPGPIRRIYDEGRAAARSGADGPFLARIEHEAGLYGDTEASFAATAAVRVLRRHLTPDEMEDVATVLPARLGGRLAR